MLVKIGDEHVKVIEDILRRGKDVKIRRMKKGIIIFEESKKIKYQDTS